MTENKDNATYLFKMPSEDYHSSESFWTSIFALYVLGTSASGRELKFPTFRYFENDKNWAFKPADPLIIPKNLNFQNIIVEGGIKRIFNYEKEMPNEFQNLKPDIIIETKEDILIIEVKTVGSELGDYKKNLYQKLAKYIKNNIKNCKLFFLISAGHEKKYDWQFLKNIDEELFPFYLLLWEQILKHLYQNFPNSFLHRCLGDLKQYCEPEEGYLKGIK